MTKLSQAPEMQWNQWLAGVIDGDGYLAIQKNGVAVCEITMGLKDEYLLAQIKQKLGGHLKLRSGAQAIRYRLSHKAGLQDLILRINGFIRNSIRVKQFKLICQHFGIEFQEAAPLIRQSSYTAGFFDADGTIWITVTRIPKEFATQKGLLGKINRLRYSRAANQLCISISNKYLENLIPFYTAFQIGKIRKVVQKSKTWHVWDIKKDYEILYFTDYLRTAQARSAKVKRVYLIERYFQLKRLNAHLAPEETSLSQAWFQFCQKWYLG